jgi:hypothetical protein
VTLYASSGHTALPIRRLKCSIIRALFTGGPLTGFSRRSRPAHQYFASPVGPRTLLAGRYLSRPRQGGIAGIAGRLAFGAVRRHRPPASRGIGRGQLAGFHRGTAGRFLGFRYSIAGGLLFGLTGNVGQPGRLRSAVRASRATLTACRAACRSANAGSFAPDLARNFSSYAFFARICVSRSSKLFLGQSRPLK